MQAGNVTRNADAENAAPLGPMMEMARLRRDSATPAGPVRPVRLGPRDVVVKHGGDGVTYLKSPHPLPPYPDNLTQRLLHWAAVAPARTFLAQRDAAGAWRRLSYAETLSAVRRIREILSTK